jgi:hypothetical protein
MLGLWQRGRSGLEQEMAEIFCDPLHRLRRELTLSTLESALDTINTTRVSTHTKPPFT